MRIKAPFTLLALLLLRIPIVFGQVTEGSIAVEASFKSYIELRIVSNPSVSWTFKSIRDYQGGFYTGLREIEFEVSSSTNFNVQASMTDLSSPLGGVLDKRYIYYRIGTRNAHKGEKNRRWKFATDWELHIEVSDGGGIFSGAHIGTGSPKTLLFPGPEGNAGDFEANQFVLRMGIGAEGNMKQLGLPSLLELNIKPGTYSGSLTLYAMAEY